MKKMNKPVNDEETGSVSHSETYDQSKFSNKIKNKFKFHKKRAF